MKEEKKGNYLHNCYNCILTGLNEALETVRKASISFPFGKGICGHVAETKETIYIKDAYNVSFTYLYFALTQL